MNCIQNILISYQVRINYLANAKKEFTINTLKTILAGLILCMLNVVLESAQAETVFYKLNNVFLDSGQPMNGTFSWSYDVEEFENGIGQFLTLDIPYTLHDHTDLDASFDLGQSVEITLPGSFHDDGVDITLVLQIPLTPTTSSPLNLLESAYEIGGNGFHTGLFLAGSIVPITIDLNISTTSADFVSISWEPDLPGFILQETSTMFNPNWINSLSGSTNPVLLPVDAPLMFYRVVLP
jgi:hypothetical protein